MNDKKIKTARIITIVKYSKQWEINYGLGKFAENLDRLPDANEIKKTKLKSAPLSILEMVF